MFGKIFFQYLNNVILFFVVMASGQEFDLLGIVVNAFYFASKDCWFDADYTDV